jgi:hypothetical protein
MSSLLSPWRSMAGILVALVATSCDPFDPPAPRAVIPIADSASGGPCASSSRFIKPRPHPDSVMVVKPRPHPDTIMAVIVCPPRR